MSNDHLRDWVLQPVMEFLHSLKKEMKMNNDEFLRQIADVDAALSDIATEVDKVSADTDSLLMEVRALQEQIAAGPGTTPAIDAALAAVQTRARGLAISMTGLDAKVPDSVAATPPAPIPAPDSTATPPATV